MKFMQETTVWKELCVDNHLYVMDDSKQRMLAFLRCGDKEFKVFKNPIPIDTRGRKFKEVQNTFGFTMKESIEGNVHKVQGSKGEVHTVVELNGKFSCTCSGYKFRGQCKHIEEVRNAN